MIGKTISHYRILEKLGEGGMGVVYKAEDLALGRTVALKFLPAELTRDPAARERFINEARTASALDHPNICTIHEVGQTDEGITFIAMAYYEGENLKDKIESRPLKIDEALDIALQLSQGLAKAHSQGIVHRDIKPANIVITKDNIAKILDFGLAKLRGTRLTRTGATLGTARYMSPEQASGREVDSRSDIWSLGVIIYEMLTGTHAFPGDYEQATLYAIINTDPEPVTALRSGIPLELERIVNKCLQKNPEERYQTAADLIADLLCLQRAIRDGTRAASSPPAAHIKPGRRWWVWAVPLVILALAAVAVIVRLPSREAAPPRDSVAVLPFVDMSPQEDQGYFCDGMTEAIISRLSNIRQLSVPARTSVFVFRGKDRDIREIGKKLNVRTVLEGSVQKSGNKLRITVQLINAADGYHIWSEAYDRDLQDVFVIQDEISSAIANALKVKITSDEKRRLSETPIDNVAAYECYLKAYDKIWQFNESSLDSAEKYLLDGVAIVGDNPLLYSALALVYWQYVNIGVAQEDYITRAQEYAEKALALDPNFSTAHEVLGTIYKDFLGDTPEAVSHYKKALAANPSELNALRKLAYTYIVIVGRPAEAAPLAARAKQLDPLEPFRYLSDAMLYLYDGEYGKALESGRDYFEADTANPLAEFVYAWTLISNDRSAEAFSIIDEAAKKTPDNVCTKFGLLLKYSLLKDKDSALREMTPEFQKTCRRDPEWSYCVALTLSLLDAKAEALDWLENAVSRGFVNYPALKREPFLSNIRGEERFAELATRVKREWENFAELDKKSPVRGLRDY
jgi:non-specific serine/threonine protein kinase